MSLFFCLRISNEKYFDNNVNLCSNNINNLILSLYDKVLIFSDKNTRFFLFNFNNSSLGVAHFLLLSNEISPVNKSNNDVGFSEHFCNLDNTISLKVLSDNKSLLLFSNISSRSLKSNNLSNNTIFTCVS